LRALLRRPRTVSRAIRHEQDRSHEDDGGSQSGLPPRDTRRARVAHGGDSQAQVWRGRRRHLARDRVDHVVERRS
jgi:hypothetical protein